MKRGPNKRPKETPTQDRVYALIVANPGGISRAGLLKLDPSIKCIENPLDALRRKGLIYSGGSGSHLARWAVTGQPVTPPPKAERKPMGAKAPHLELDIDDPIRRQRAVQAAIAGSARRFASVWEMGARSAA